VGEAGITPGQMIIGLLMLELYFPHSHSLKEKRKILNRIRDRVKRRYNVAFAEIDHLDKWQRAKLGIVTLNTQKGGVVRVFQDIVGETEENMEGVVLEKEILFF